MTFSRRQWSLQVCEGLREAEHVHGVNKTSGSISKPDSRYLMNLDIQESRL